MKEKDHFNDLGVVWRKILKWAFKRQDVSYAGRRSVIQLKVKYNSNVYAGHISTRHGDLSI